MDPAALFPPEGDNNLILSHSEVDTFNDCHKKHEYAHRQRLAPIELNDRIMIGTIGHSALEIYYRGVQNGESRDIAAANAEQAIQDMYGEEHLLLVVKVLPLIRRYFREYATEDFKILYVEQEFYYFVEEIDGTNLWFAMKPDLVVQEPLRNGVTVIDHKFVGRFYSAETISMSPQMVRYSTILGKLGLPLQSCVYNQIHTNPAKQKPKYLERSAFQPTYARSKTTWDDTVDTMRAIYAERLRDQPSRRQPGPMKCNFCMFQPLCSVEMNNVDASLMRRVNYGPSTYGYGLTPTEE